MPMVLILMLNTKILLHFAQNMRHASQFLYGIDEPGGERQVCMSLAKSTCTEGQGAGGSSKFGQGR